MLVDDPHNIYAEYFEGEPETFIEDLDGGASRESEIKQDKLED